MKQKIVVVLSSESIERLDSILLAMDEAEVDIISPIVDDVLKAYVSSKASDVIRTKKIIETDEDDEGDGYA